MQRYLIVHGEPASKANSRRLVTVRGKPMFIKSSKAIGYAMDFNREVKKVEPLLLGELSVHMWMYYATQRPDLDESLVLDLLQDKIYVNDRQVRERHIYHGIDKHDPRVEILVVERSSDPEYQEKIKAALGVGRDSRIVPAVQDYEDGEEPT